MVDKQDRLKTAFTTKWEIFAYRRMSFGLEIVGVTFQRAMDIAFKDLVSKCIIIYMDDLIVFLKDMSTHLQDLRKVLKKCEQYGISLNPKKCMFGVTKGKLLGHIIF